MLDPLMIYLGDAADGVEMTAKQTTLPQPRT